MEPGASPCAPVGSAAALKFRRGGPYGWLTPWLSLMTSANASIASRILSLPRDELHFIALTLALMGEARNDAARLGAFASALGCRRREAILAEAAPDVEARLARLCGKLAGRPWRPATYHRLAALAAEPNARKTLAHARKITRRDVLTLARLPPAYRTSGVLRMVKRPHDLANVLFAIEIVRRVRTDLSDRQILASLERADSEIIRRWVEAHYERLPFPAAPTGPLTDGLGGVLRPVCDGDELRRTGSDYENCVENYLLRSHAGVCAFYRYERANRRVAVIEIRRTPGVGWAIEEIAGPNNEPVSGDDRSRIIQTFAGAGVAAAPQALSRHRWLDLG